MSTFHLLLNFPVCVSVNRYLKIYTYTSAPVVPQNAKTTHLAKTSLSRPTHYYTFLPFNSYFTKRITYGTNISLKSKNTKLKIKSQSCLVPQMHKCGS